MFCLVGYITFSFWIIPAFRCIWPHALIASLSHRVFYPQNLVCQRTSWKWCSAQGPICLEGITLTYSSTFEYILNLVHAAPRLQVHLQPAAGLESVMWQPIPLSSKIGLICDFGWLREVCLRILWPWELYWKVYIWFIFTLQTFKKKSPITPWYYEETT